MIILNSTSKEGTNIQEASGQSMVPNATITVNCKAWNSPVEYPSRECKYDVRESIGNMFNPILKENVEKQKYLGSCTFAEPYLRSSRKPKRVFPNEKNVKKNPIVVTTIMMKIMMKSNSI